MRILYKDNKGTRILFTAIIFYFSAISVKSIISGRKISLLTGVLVSLIFIGFSIFLIKSEKNSLQDKSREVYRAKEKIFQISIVGVAIIFSGCINMGISIMLADIIIIAMVFGYFSLKNKSDDEKVAFIIDEEGIQEFAYGKLKYSLQWNEIDGVEGYLNRNNNRVIVVPKDISKYKKSRGFMERLATIDSSFMTINERLISEKSSIVYAEIKAYML